MKKLATLIALAALAAGCSATDNSNMAAHNGNTAAVVNNNANNANTAAANANANAANRGNYNANITEADYDRDKDRYGREAKEKGESIGSGLKDGYLWVKTKGTLAGVDDLRDSSINVDVDNGVITLRGDVASAQQKAAAVKAANGIDGKKSVVDKLQIKADASGSGAANSNNTKAGGAHGNANH
ncbi:MAG TPA: BON domain-containing protein [Pyrinomonadaceae bacterium]|jgi:hypothetical protein